MYNELLSDAIKQWFRNPAIYWVDRRPDGREIWERAGGDVVAIERDRADGFAAACPWQLEYLGDQTIMTPVLQDAQFYCLSADYMFYRIVGGAACGVQAARGDRVPPRCTRWVVQRGIGRSS